MADAASYSRTDNLYGQSFLDAFAFEAIPDPTNGRTNYLDQSDAASASLYSVSGNTVTLRADDTTVLDPNGPGRNTFRLTSNNQYTNHVAIFDIAHMPQGCGTWPAVCKVGFGFSSEMCSDATWVSFWLYREVGADWPDGGEIDIVEGVNNQIPNQSTLHTSSNCAMSPIKPILMTGTNLMSNCDVYSTDNEGCGIRLASDLSFGPKFNDNGGGWYAIERNAHAISIWFWPRSDSSVPSQVSDPGNTVDTSTWGMASAYFPNTHCDFSTHLEAMNIIINLAFCGDWAGAAYSGSGCPGSCTDFVNNNPSAFKHAYFEFHALHIYQ